ncbi:MAG: DUF523 domain-containing protein [Peptostreptococcaceae bacterium]|nr:DUF523 domain-containing protein [Peptostreptococcaceae bacterium]
MYIVSRCLLGENCKYNGMNNYDEKVVVFLKNKSYASVCPEMEGGLSCPRSPAELVEDRVIDRDGLDVTKEFHQGAVRSLKLAREMALCRGEDIELAITKANSPSCGCGQIYDGSFSGRLRQGDGCFVRLLKENNIPVITEKEIVDDKL